MNQPHRISRLFLSLALLTWLMVAISCVGYSMANPYTSSGEVSSDQETYPPVITVISPINNSASNTSIVPLTFNVTAPQSATASFTTLQFVTYKADWYNQSIMVYGSGKEQQFKLQLSKVPEGQHSILIDARGYGRYPDPKCAVLYKEFLIRSTATIILTVDQTAPTIKVLPPENVSSNSTIPLDFTVNDDVSKVTYSLNKQQNITVTGNSTIAPLPAGDYNLTLYAWDCAGNVGTSETANFSVSEPPQTKGAVDGLLLPVAFAFLFIVAIIAIVMLFSKKIK